MTTETIILGQLDKLFTELTDDERRRALDWLRAKYVANASLPATNTITKTLEQPWTSPDTKRIC